MFKQNLALCKKSSKKDSEIKIYSKVERQVTSIKRNKESPQCSP